MPSKIKITKLIENLDDSYGDIEYILDNEKLSYSVFVIKKISSRYSGSFEWTGK
jgi:hypothetical protein